MSWTGGSLFLRSYGLLNRKCRMRQEISSYELLVRELLRSSKQYRCLPYLLVTHHNYVMTPYNWKPYVLRCQDIETSISKPLGKFIPTGYLSYCQKVICSLLWKKRHQWPYQILTLNATILISQESSVNLQNGGTVVIK